MTSVRDFRTQIVYLSAKRLILGGFHAVAADCARKSTNWGTGNHWLSRGPVLGQETRLRYAE